MSNIRDLEKAITDLPPNDLANFRAWFEKFDNKNWDQQFEQDVKLGRLDKYAEQVIKDFQEKRFKEL